MITLTIASYISLVVIHRNSCGPIVACSGDSFVKLLEHEVNVVCVGLQSLPLPSVQLKIGQAKYAGTYLFRGERDAFLPRLLVPLLAVELSDVNECRACEPVSLATLEVYLEMNDL